MQKSQSLRWRTSKREATGEESWGSLRYVKSTLWSHEYEHTSVVTKKTNERQTLLSIIVETFSSFWLGVFEIMSALSAIRSVVVECVRASIGGFQNWRPLL
jgi:hypothetical protein